MLFKYLSVLPFCLFGVVGNAIAESDVRDDRGWFVGFSALYRDTEENVNSESFDSYRDYTGFEKGFLAGYNFNRQFGLDLNIYTFDTLDFTDDGIVGLTPRFSVPLTDSIDLYIRGGVHYVTKTYRQDDFLPTAGIGFRIDLSNQWRMNIGYDYSEGDIDAEALVYGYQQTDGGYVVDRIDSYELKNNLFSASFYCQF